MQLRLSLHNKYTKSGGALLSGEQLELQLVRSDSVEGLSCLRSLPGVRLWRGSRDTLHSVVSVVCSWEAT